MAALGLVGTGAIVRAACKMGTKRLLGMAVKKEIEKLTKKSIVTANGIKIKRIAKHGINRIIRSMERFRLKSDGILDILK